MDKPIITPAVNGEYSTITLPGGLIETIFFGDDGSQVFVGRTVMSVREIANQQIAAFESRS
jgi:hypothetical protein